MNKIATGIILAIISVVIIGVSFVYLRRPERLITPPPPSPALTPPSSPTQEPTPQPTSQPTPQPQVKTATIDIIPSGFSPTNLTISVGTIVTFVNKDTKGRWPASGIHPTHQLCPGFDPLKPIPAGESWSFTFTVAKTCPMHDHLYPALRGSITVQ